tara:strand:+ start:26 stop:799 length:774 start_codon:yes stop_codon:yes gene_type:complete
MHAVSIADEPLTIGNPGANAGGVSWSRDQKYSILRLVLFLFWFAVCVWDLFYAGEFYEIDFYFIYYTNWTMWLLLVYLFLALVHTGMVTFMEGSDGGEGKMQKINRIVCQVLQPTVLVSTLTVTLTFWSFGFYFDPVHALNIIFAHGVNFAVALVDFLALKDKMQLKTIGAPVVYLLINFIFSAVYGLSGGINFYGDSGVYKEMDWKASPLKTFLLSILALTATLVLFTPFYFLQQLWFKDDKHWYWRTHTLHTENL